MPPKSRNRASMDAEAVARMMAAQDEADAAPPPEAPAIDAAPAPMHEPSSEFDPGKVDGRTLRRTGREPFATRIKPETQARLKRIAFGNRITIAEALEMVVAAWEGPTDRH